MSVMDELKNVVTTGRELLSTVSGKMKEIDQKVEQATAAVGKQIRSDMNSIIYVNADSGDDKNAGNNRSDAKKTIHSAIISTPPNSSVEIRLIGANSHELNQVTMLEGRKVSIRSVDAVYGEPATYSVIRQRAWIAGSSTGSYIQGAGFRVGVQGYISFGRCIIDTAYLNDPSFDAAGMRDYQTSVVSSQASVGHLWLEGVVVNINHLPLTHQHTSGSLGYLDLVLRHVSINKIDISEAAVKQSIQLLIGSYGNDAAPFSMYTTEGISHNAESLSSLISARLDNVVSNIDFSL